MAKSIVPPICVGSFAAFYTHKIMQVSYEPLCDVADFL